MGKVWRAHHTALNRDDALKVLPDAFVSDPERLARFRREAQVLASLNHPNIAHVYGLEQSDGVQALVMELVEGPTLADRIAQGPVPIDEALGIAKQIAEALEAAHEQGIVHRDLKPANIKVRLDGTVKVLDFGLAKALDPIASSAVGVTASPTITSPALMTGVGMLLGTAAYMSPEQARGRAIDKRSDIWAFGCVLYEMLTGTRAFEDEDVSMTLSKVLQRDPDFDALPADVPAHVRQAVRLCLRKSVKERIGSLHDVLLALEGAFESPASRHFDTYASTRPAGWRRVLMPAATFLFGGAIAGSMIWLATRPEASRVVRMELPTTGAAELSVQGFDRDIAITPDGSRIVYRGQNRLVVRALDQLDITALTDLGMPRSPFVSPDGEWVGFLDGVGTIKRVAITGGPAVTVTEIDGNGSRGATWGEDGTIIFATNSPQTGLQRVSASGGKPVLLTTPNAGAGELDHAWPEFLPGGQAVLYTILPAGGSLDAAQVAVLDLRTNTQKTLIRGGHHGHYVPSGHLMYGAEGTLRAVAFDLSRLDVAGTSVPVLDQALTTPAGAVEAVVATNGTLAYISGSIEAETRQFMWFDRDGKPQGSVGDRVSGLRNFTLTPDGDRLAAQIGVVAQLAEGGQGVWLTDLKRNITSLLVAAGTDPVWSRNGSRLAFSRSGRTISSISAAGGEPQLLFEAPDERLMYVEDWHPDGERLAVLFTGTGGDEGAVVDVAHDQAPVTFDRARDLDEPHFSPDGKWIAYNADRDGRGMQVYVVPYPPTGERVQVSPGGGGQPRWRGDGRELFYLDPSGTLMVVGVNTQNGLKLGVPTSLFDTGLNVNLTLDQYALTSDGRRFILPVAAWRDGASQTRRLVVVLNWLEELKRLVPN